MILYLINLALLLMLLASTTYMILVNRRLRALKNGQDQIGPTIRSFARATGDMAETVTRLNSDAAAVTQNLERAIARAKKVQGEIDRTLAEASAEARLIARDRSRFAAGDPVRRADPRADLRSEPPVDPAPGRGEADARRPHPGDPERDGAATREWFPVKKSEGPKSCRPWVPRRTSDEDLRADAMKMFYGAPKSA